MIVVRDGRVLNRYGAGPRHKNNHQTENSLNRNVFSLLRLVQSNPSTSQALKAGKVPEVPADSRYSVLGVENCCHDF